MKNILFVDDEKPFLDAIRRLLKRQALPWRLFFAQSVTSALEILKTTPIDTIVSDIQMTTRSGFDLLGLVQSDDQLKNIPFIMLTGASQNDLKFKALEMGATDLLNKPLVLPDLMARINGCLKLKSYHDQIIAQNLSLEQQVKEKTRQALLSAQISATLVQKEPLKTLLKACTRALAHRLDLAGAGIWVFDEKQKGLELMAETGLSGSAKSPNTFIPIGRSEIGKIAAQKRPCLTNAIQNAPQICDPAWAREKKLIGFAGYPLVLKGTLVGVMGLFSQTPLEPAVLTDLDTIANKLALGIKERKEADMIHFLSFYDGLTRLPNRHLFYDYVNRAIMYANRYSEHFALAFIDLDNFNHINKSLGHKTGDACLKTVSRRLIRMLRESDLIARSAQDKSQVISMGGDHFALLLHTVHSIGKLSTIARRILDELSQSIFLDSHEVYLTACMGIVLFPEDGQNVDVLFQNGETALDHVKKTGPDNFGFYSKAMNAAALKFLDFETQLRRAIDQKALSVHYQPKLDLTTRTVTGVEALVRWFKPDNTAVPPQRFIAHAEANNLIIPIGNFVLETACAQNKAWQDQGLSPIRVAVNVSGAQLGQKDLVPRILSILETTQLAPRFLEVEITETSLMEDPENAIVHLKALKEKGITISLDDFGTGYSSLAYLQKLPLDTLKIDLAFVKHILTRPGDAVIVKTIIAMAHSLGLKVIAEGVEEVKQLAFLEGLGCDIIQGYWFSRPVPADQIPDFIAPKPCL